MPARHTFARLEIRHLRYFCAIAETLNISEASRRLRIAQPSLSRQVRDLEDEIGRPLFERAKGRLKLTETGIAFRSHATRIVSDFDATMTHFRSIGAPAEKELRIGYYATTWATLLSPALPRFRREFPEIVLRGFEIPPAQIAEELKNGALDVGILLPGGIKYTREIVVTKIGTVPAQVALPVDHPLAKRRSLHLEELREETFLSYSSIIVPGRDRSLLEACRAIGFKPKLLCEAAGLPALLLAVGQNRGIALVSPFASTAPHPGVVFSRLKTPGVEFDLFVGYRSRASAAAKRLIELVATENERAAKKWNLG